MRLICPNCSAEYEVDDAAIPDSGRDVQCSNCGHGWFQLPAHLEAEAEAEAEVFEEPEAPVTETAPAAVQLPGGSFEDDDEDEDRGLTPPPAEPAKAPRSLDDSVLAVLKEEAEREATARRAEAMRTIETQPDLGLDSAVAGAVAASAAAERDAKARKKPVEVIPSAEDIAREAEAEAAAPPARASRRGQLPDIEEINSSLRSTADRGGSAADGDFLDAPRRRSSFGRGFMLMILLALVLAVLYLMAPRFAAQVPALKPALDSYVGAVDAARLSIDGLLKNATGAVEKVAPPPSN